MELGKRWVFATALDWPGWSRRGTGEEAAVETLLTYAERYATVAGPSFLPGEVDIVGRVPGTGATDFGVPDARGPWDDEPLGEAEAERLIGLLSSCWLAFDGIAAYAPVELRKGPRGGGRDRDGIVDHVRESERSYGRSIGVKVPPGTPWDEQRAALTAALGAGAPGGRWPVRYAIRRIAWHVLDHAWEIEDKSL